MKKKRNLKGKSYRKKKGNNFSSNNKTKSQNKKQKNGFWIFLRKIFSAVSKPITREDYEREVLVDDETYAFEKFQVRLKRILNGNLLELLLVFYRIVLIVGFIAAFVIGGRLLVGVPDPFAPFGTY